MERGILVCRNRGRHLAMIWRLLRSSDSQSVYEYRSNALRFGCIEGRAAYGIRECYWESDISR